MIDTYKIIEAMIAGSILGFIATRWFYRRKILKLWSQYISLNTRIQALETLKNLEALRTKLYDHNNHL